MIARIDFCVRGGTQGDEPFLAFATWEGWIMVGGILQPKSSRRTETGSVTWTLFRPALAASPAAGLDARLRVVRGAELLGLTEGLAAQTQVSDSFMPETGL